MCGSPQQERLRQPRQEVAASDPASSKATGDTDKMSLQRQVMAKVGCLRWAVGGKGRLSLSFFIFSSSTSLLLLLFLCFPPKLRSSFFPRSRLLPLSLPICVPLPSYPSPPFLLLPPSYPSPPLLLSPSTFFFASQKIFRFYDGFWQKQSSLSESDCKDGNSDATPRP